jgi:hypothetical protein
LFADGEDVFNEAGSTLTLKNSSLQLHHSTNLTQGVINKGGSKTGTVNIDNSRIDLGKAAVYGDTINVNSGSEVLTHINAKTGSEFGKLSANTINVSNNDTAITIRVKAGEHLSEGETKTFKILDAATIAAVEKTGFASITKNGMYDIEYLGNGVYELSRPSDGPAIPDVPIIPDEPDLPDEPDVPIIPDEPDVPSEPIKETITIVEAVEKVVTNERVITEVQKEIQYIQEDAADKLRYQSALVATRRDRAEELRHRPPVQAR